MKLKTFKQTFTIMNIHTNHSNYLDSKLFLSTQIAKAKLRQQITGIEFMIETLFLKKVLKETNNDTWIAESHCNDLQTECLIKRCELLAQQYPTNE